jgi:4-carboxymuconolactone decarboxylase
MENTKETLTIRQRHLVTISAFTAKSDVARLKIALNEGLDAGLTVNEINEELAHLYAYCGFPASIRGINTFKDVVNERKAKGIKDEKGKEASAIDQSISRYTRGENAQMIVTAMSAAQLKTLFAFNPLIDVFLKEHLFADIFDRDILSYTDREIVTVSALVSVIDAFMPSHVNGALNVGVSKEQLKELFDVMESKVGKQEADAGRKVLDEVLAERQKS